MENLEDMKSMWSALNDRISFLEEENRKLARRAMTNKYKTAREKLISKYKKFIFIETVMILYVWVFIGFNPETVDKYRLPTLIYWSLFFLAEIGIDYYLMERVREIDIYTSPVKEITQMAASNWRIHKLAIFIGLPIAFGAIILFGLAMDANEFVIYGMVAGAIVGLIIGFSQLRRFMSYYRQLKTIDSEE